MFLVFETPSSVRIHAFIQTLLDERNVENCKIQLDTCHATGEECGTAFSELHETEGSVNSV